MNFVPSDPVGVNPAVLAAWAHHISSASFSMPRAMTTSELEKPSNPKLEPTTATATTSATTATIAATAATPTATATAAACCCFFLHWWDKENQNPTH